MSGSGRTILVTGGTGLLGSRLVPFLAASGFDVVTHGREHDADVRCDLRDRACTERMVASVKPDQIVHLVSVTSVDACERDPQMAFEVNVETVKNVVAGLRGRGKGRLVYVSTDHLYDGPGANVEEALQLRNTYALTKLWAEHEALRTDAAVLRTNFFGRSHVPWRQSFSDWVRKAMLDPEGVILLSDVRFSPLSIETLGDVIRRVLDAGITGVFNAGSRTGMSKAEFARTVAAALGGSLEGARNGQQQDLELDAARPAGMVMDSARLERTLEIELPTLEDEINSAEL